MLLLRLIGESFLFAIHSLAANKTRTILSLLGISIGIFAIISVFTVIDSMERRVRDSVKSLGENVIYIQKWSWEFNSDYPWWKYMNRPVPKYSEMQELERILKNSEALAFEVSANNKTVKYRNYTAENSSVIGTSFNFNKIKSFELQEGRYFSFSESNTGKNFAIIGATIADNLFSLSNPLGKSISVLGRKLTIIGVFKKEGESVIGNSMDNTVLIPLNFARNVVDVRNDRSQPLIMVKAKAGVSNMELVDELRGVMRSVRSLTPREDDDFSLNEASLLSNKLDNLFNMIGVAGWIIGGFSILVGGFGIANIMFVSVKERTNIIGIQKSLGAKSYFILFQFLTESVILSLIGGAIGLLVIFAGTIISTLGFGFDIGLSLNNIILGLSVSGIIGVVSGFIPAYKASEMNPVEAIRSN